mmetsp:Transcript_17532/g.24864  ORF Transcript_17532/g.24864 Transcript_17532/m.24864 type:complete len:345 (+) Transcript_17532:92-1126(+)
MRSAHSRKNIGIIKAALAVVATCLSFLLSSADAFAPLVKSNTAASRQQHQFGSTTCLSAASIASPLPPTLPTFTLFGLNIKKQQTTSSKKSTSTAPLFSIPSIFHPTDSRPIILFDGKCNLCNAGVQLIMDNDRASNDPRGNLRVAALQSKVGQLLLSRLSPQDRSMVTTNNEDFKTIVVAGRDTTTFNSAACVYIGRNLKGPLRYLALLASLIPSFIRDPLYKLLSRHRKRFFGESAECRLWDENYDLSVGPNVKVGDSVKVISKGQQPPIVHTHVEGGNNGGVCSVGLVGKVVRVLEQRAYPKNVVVKFDNVDCGGDIGDDESSSSTMSFEAHFFPGQLRKE